MLPLSSWCRFCHRSVKAATIAAALAASLARGGEASEPCLGPEVTSVPMLDAGGVSAVSVSLNGRMLPLIVDTGATHVALADRAARTLGLAENDLGVSVASGIGGVLTHGLIDLRELRLAGLRVSDSNVPVIGLSLPVVDGEQAAGVLGTSVLGLFDVDLDFAAARMTLFLHATCGGVTPPWDGAWSSLPFATEPSNLEALLHHGDVESVANGLTRYRGLPHPNKARLFTIVTVNGVPLIALIDSGASVSTLTPEAAARAGIVAGGTPLTLIGTDQHPVDGRLVHTSSVMIGTDTRSDVALGVADLDIGKADMLLGHDLMAGRRMLISFGAARLFWQAP